MTRFRAGSDRIRAHVPPFDFRSFLPRAYDSPYSSAPTIFCFCSATIGQRSIETRIPRLTLARSCASTSSHPSLPHPQTIHMLRAQIPSLTCICNRFRPPTPVQPFSLTTRNNGSSRPMRALLQNDQVRHNPHSLELQYVPLRASLVHLRMSALQVEDV